MKKYSIILFTLFLIIYGYSKIKSKNTEHKTPRYIEVNHQPEQLENKPVSLKDDFLNNKKANTSPVKIIESKLSRSQYSDHKDIKIVFKNSGKKDIQAIKFEWYCENSFDEPANGRYFYGEGKSTGEITYLLKAGQTRTKVWEDFSTDANEIIKARAYYIVFTDGTKWKLK